MDATRAETVRRRLTGMLNLACTLEAVAPKAGNVHPTAAFDDLGIGDFLAASAVTAPVLADAGRSGVGRAVLEAIEACGQVTRSNANLGIVLLLAPLSAAAHRAAAGGSLHDSVATVLEELDGDDGRDVYAAIRLAAPGGMGRAERLDVSDTTGPVDLLEAMREAADRDRIARQYVTGFAEVFEVVAPLLREHAANEGDWLQAIRWTQIDLLARWPDSLIARQSGADEAERVRRAAERLRTITCPTERETGWRAFDAELRRPASRRNPGTTADLIAAGLFVALWTGMIRPGEVK